MTAINLWQRIIALGYNTLQNVTLYLSCLPEFIIPSGNTHEIMHPNKDQIKEIEHKLSVFLLTERPFLRHGYTLKQMAADMNISLHYLSAFINQHLGMNFNDLINRYRIDYCIVKLMAEEWKQKKLEALSDESGFNNRNTFRMAFKKVTGLSPSEYLRNIERNPLKHIDDGGR